MVVEKETTEKLPQSPSLDWPSELFNKVFENLQEISNVTSLLDIIQVMNALNGTFHFPALSNFKDTMMMIDFTGARSKEELLRISRCAGSLISDSNFVLPYEKCTIFEAFERSAHKRTLAIIDNDISVDVFEGNLKKCTDVIFCCDSFSSLECGKIGEIISAIANEANRTGTPPKHLLLDFSKDTLICPGNKILGFLDRPFLEQLCEYESILNISVPNVTHLEMNYTMHQRFIGSFLTAGKDRPRRSLPAGKNQFQRFFGFQFNFPSLVSIAFVNPRIPERRLNLVNLSYDRISQLRKTGISLRDTFKIYSFAQWDFPQLKKFPGQYFYVTDSLSLEGSSCPNDPMIRESLVLLADTVKDELDTSALYPIDLFPKYVKKTRIVNWITGGISYNELSGEDQQCKMEPLFKVNLNSLEVLELKPLSLRANLTVTIGGLYLPNLKILSLIGSKAVSEFREQNSYLMIFFGPRVVEQQDQATSESSNITNLEKIDQQIFRTVYFTRSNELTNCEKVNTSKFNTEEGNHLLKVKNLQSIMPKIDLTQSFCNSFGEDEVIIF